MQDPKLTRYTTDGPLGVEVLVHHGDPTTYEVRVAGFVLVKTANPNTALSQLEDALAEMRMARTALSRATGIYPVAVTTPVTEKAEAEEASL